MGKVRENSRSRVLGKGTASKDPELGLGLGPEPVPGRQTGKGIREGGSLGCVHSLGHWRAIHSLATVSSAAQGALLWLLQVSSGPEWAFHRTHQRVTQMCRVKCTD